VTNVSRRDGPVKPGDVIEISGLLAEVIRSGRLARGTAEAGGDPADGTRGVVHAGEMAGPHGHEGDAAATSSSGPGPALPSPHVIRAAIFIHENGPQTVGQLARGLGTSQGWTSRIVDELERAGYVEKARDPGDRRVVRVGLTPMAAERVERVARWRGDAVDAALAGMTADDRATIATFLRRFLDATRTAG
jgi:DNA-binding MarR family transcriptional regulator